MSLVPIFFVIYDKDKWDAKIKEIEEYRKTNHGGYYNLDTEGYACGIAPYDSYQKAGHYAKQVFARKTQQAHEGKCFVIALFPLDSEIIL